MDIIKLEKGDFMSTTVISAIALAIPIVLGIIGIALFSAKKNKEEWKKSLFFMVLYDKSNFF